MNKEKFFKIRLYFTAIITLAIWSLLAWDHYHGGVPSHHLLADEQMPAFSNWWGGLLLPLLTWFLLYRVQKSALDKHDGKYASPTFLRRELYGFAGALLFGIFLSVFFTLGLADLPGYMLLGLFAFSLFFPIYRAECLLGFVIGMTFTFGAVLPTGVGTILALIGLVLYLYIRTAVYYVGSRVATMVSSRNP